MTKSKFFRNEKVRINHKCLKRIYNRENIEDKKYKLFDIKSYYEIYDLNSGEQNYKYILKQFPLIIFNTKDLIKIDKDNIELTINSFKLKKLVSRK